MRRSLLGCWFVVVLLPMVSNAENTKLDEQGRLVSTKSSETIRRMNEVFPPDMDGESPYSNQTITQQCQRDMLSTSVAMEQSHEWAWLAIDAAGQVGPGVFLGNLQYVGNYDECRKVKASGETYTIAVGGTSVQHKHTSDGKYCRVYWRLNGEEFASYGDCVPSSCQTSDIRNIYALGNESLPVDSVYCEEPKDFFSDMSAVVGMVMCIFFVLLVLVASLVDLIRTCRDKKKAYNEPQDVPLRAVPHESSPGVEPTEMPTQEATANKTEATVESGATPVDPNHSTEPVTTKERPTDSPGKALGILFSFSLMRNVPKLLSTKSQAYSCMNGMRILAMWWVLYGHSYQLGKLLLTDQHLQMLENKDEFGKYPFLMFWVFLNGRGVEVFFVLSGCLVTISFLKALDRNGGRQSVKQMVRYYLHRYIRLSTVLMFILMVYACLFPYFGNGPTPPQYMEYNYCRKNWWINLLYLQNIIDTYHQCLSWTWYVANDWAYYCVAPLFIYLLYRWPKCGRAFLVCTWIAYFGVRIAVTILFGPTYWHLYIPPWTRIGPYLMGIALGYTMFITKCDVKKIHPALQAFLWILVIMLFGMSCFGIPWLSLFNGDIFAFVISVIIFFCCAGYGGFIHAFLSWRFFVPLARLSYTVYLIHPILMYYHMEFRKRPLYMEQESMFFISHGYLLVTYFVAFFVSLVFEIPFLEMESRIFPKRK